MTHYQVPREETSINLTNIIISEQVCCSCVCAKSQIWRVSRYMCQKSNLASKDIKKLPQIGDSVSDVINHAL